MKASEKGHTDILKYLLEHKADVNAEDDVITALPDGLFDSLRALKFCDAAVGYRCVCTVGQHRASEG